jgi:hypothetical protein
MPSWSAFLFPAAVLHCLYDGQHQAAVVLFPVVIKKWQASWTSPLISFIPGVTMSLTMHQISIPVFIRALNNLSTLLNKAVAHVEENKLDPDTLLSARLFEDMYPLTGQIQRASDAAKFAASRLSAIPPPSFADEETTFPHLQERIAKTIAYLETVTPEQLDGSAEREIVIKLRGNETTFTGQAYLLTFALPNFLFHITTAYDILRHKGVKIGKMDYLGF